MEKYFIRDKTRQKLTSIPIMLSTLILLVASILFSAGVFAINASGSEFSVGTVSYVTANGNTNGTDYSSNVGTVPNAITSDAQGLENGAVIGISGNAVLTQDKVPVIKSYSITPHAANTSSWVRMFVSAVYTHEVSINITRPDNTVDTISLGSQKVYYYPYTNLLGRYDVVFIAEGNTVVTADDYFDVSEDEEPYVPPEEEPRGNGGSGSSTVIDYDMLHISIMHICKNASGINLEVANNTGTVPGALVIVRSAVSGDIVLNSTTDDKGLVRFNISPGNYTITASAAGHVSSERNYELVCEGINLTDDGSVISSISGDAVQNNLGDGSASSDDLAGGLTAEELASAARILQGRSTEVFTTSFLAYLAFASIVLVFALIIIFKFSHEDYEHDASTGRQRIQPRFIVVNNTGAIEKKLMPIEKAIIRMEDEIQELAEENKKKDAATDKEDKLVDGKPKNAGIALPLSPRAGIDLKAGISPKNGVKILELEEVQSKDDASMHSKNERMQKEAAQKTTPVVTTSAATTPAVKASVVKTPVVKIVPEIQAKYQTGDYLSDVPEQKAFVLCDGSRICSITELLRQLRLMNEDMFRYHVTDYKNDFATWIYHSVGYTDLAEAIGPVKSKEKMIDIMQFGIDRLNG